MKKYLINSFEEYLKESKSENIKEFIERIDKNNLYFTRQDDNGLFYELTISKSNDDISCHFFVRKSKQAETGQSKDMLIKQDNVIKFLKMLNDENWKEVDTFNIPDKIKISKQSDVKIDTTFETRLKRFVDNDLKQKGIKKDDKRYNTAVSYAKDDFKRIILKREGIIGDDADEILNSYK